MAYSTSLFSFVCCFCLKWSAVGHMIVLDSGGSFSPGGGVIGGSFSPGGGVIGGSNAGPVGRPLGRIDGGGAVGAIGGAIGAPRRRLRLMGRDDEIHYGSKSDTQLWRYYGPRGPQNWPTMYPVCGRYEQSPVNIDTRRVIVQRFSPARLFGYGLIVDSLLENIEHSVQVRVGNHGDVVRGAGLPGAFVLESVHFHWGRRDNRGSEHTINNRPFPMEMHMVHYNRRYGSFGGARGRPDGKAVLAFVFKIGRYNPGMQVIINQLRRVRYADTQTRMPPFRLRDLMRTTLSLFYRYDGSLTTPPCSETVSWVLFPKPIEISKAQMHAFQTRLLNQDMRNMSDNYRPLRGLNGRRVYANHPSLKYTPYTPIKKLLG